MNDRTWRSPLIAIARSCGFGRRRRDQAGASLVEFAIILPVFALMLFGMIQFGLAFAGWDELRNAVQTGARMTVNNNDINNNPNCAQIDAGSNMVCQIALLIGSPVDTSPTLVEPNVLIPPAYICTYPLQSCSGPSGGYSWLDGHYIFDTGQWLQIVNSTYPSSAQISDNEAFHDGVGAWTCATTSNSTCTSVINSGTSQTQGSLGNLLIPPAYSCTYPLQSCTGSSGGYAWLDGYYIFDSGQWLQIVNSTYPSSGQISDNEAFHHGVGAWTCATTSGSTCTSVINSGTSQTQGSLGSDNLTINVEPTNSQVDVCAQRQVVSFTALPAIQAVHISTTSSFYLALTSTSTTFLGCTSQSISCVYQSANGVTCG
jgi:hypothetical protein